MNDLLIHELGARRIHWRYDDPSGVPDAATVRAGSPSVRSAGELRVRSRRRLTAKAA